MLLIALLCMLATEAAAGERDCTHYEGMWAFQDDDCNPEVGPICPKLVDLCQKRQARIAEEEAERLQRAAMKKKIQDEKQGAALLARYLALPAEWRIYAGCVFERGTDIVHDISLIDAGRLRWDHVYLIKEFEEALTRAETAIHAVKL